MESVLTVDDLEIGFQTGPLTWHGEPLLCFTCPLGALRTQLPDVVRRPFALTSNGHRGAENPYYDLILRLPQDNDQVEIPLGLVSKRYRLVQHSELLDRVVAGIEAAGLPWQTLRTDVRLTELGSRLHFSIHLPDKFFVKIGDDRLDLTIECLNSVDRSRAVHVGMGWIRSICGNGLFIGRITASLRHAHVQSLRVDDVPGLIAKGFEAAELDSTRWQNRAKMSVNRSVLDAWIDDVVAKKWGLASAARVIHIARTGRDGQPSDPREKVRPSERRLVTTVKVPGSEPPNNNVFRIAQVLAWVANTPSEWGSRLERRRHIPILLAPLVRAAAQHTKTATADS